MTPAERRQLEWLERQSRRLEPGLRRAYMEALAQLRDGADLDAAVRALLAGNVPAAVDALLTPEAMAVAESTLAVGSIRAMLAAGASAMRTEIPASLRVQLDGPSEAIMTAIQRLTAMDARPVLAGARAGVRQVLEAGLRQGQNPRVVARMARSMIGLTDYDIQLVETFELQLRGDPAAALGRSLRDHRYDGSLEGVARGTRQLTESEITAMRDAYAARLHAWRAETYSRTATLNAVREGQATAWGEAADQAAIPRDRLVKTWIATLDDRTRPAHRMAHGLVVPMDEPYPVDGGVMTPGEGVYNCRCTQSVRLLPADPVRRAAFWQERAARRAKAQADQQALSGMQ